MIGVIIGHKLATLHELRTCYGTKDMWDLYEIAQVDAHNRRVAQRVRELIEQQKKDGSI